MEDPKRELLKEAAKIANRRACKELLPDDAPDVLKNGGWNPYDPATIYLGFDLRMPDEYVLRIMKDPALNDKAMQIATESVLEAIMTDKKSTKPFLEDILQTLIGR